jgi:PPP family 3-phenylpropionic acid transporter
MSPHAVLSLLYAALVGSYAGMVFLSAVLTDAGFDDATVAALLLAQSVAATLAAPLWPALADRSGQHARLLRLLLAASAALCAVQLAVTGTAAWLLVLAAFGFTRGGVGPLLDAATLDALGDRRDAYGRVRAWGSASYLVAVTATGALQELHPRGAVAVALLGLAVAWAVTTASPLRDQPPLAPTPLTQALWLPGFGGLLAVSVLHGVTITAYDGLLPVLTASRGLPTSVAGYALATGVAAEIAVMIAAPWWLRRFGPTSLVLLGLASGVPRWWWTGADLGPAALIGLQLLHGLGFGAWWSGGVALFAARAPPGRAATAQGLLLLGTFGLGRMASMALAAVALRYVSPGDLFRGLAAVSVAATTAGWWATRPSR